MIEQAPPKLHWFFARAMASAESEKENRLVVSPGTTRKRLRPPRSPQAEADANQITREAAWEAGALQVAREAAWDKEHPCAPHHVHHTTRAVERALSPRLSLYLGGSRFVVVRKKHTRQGEAG